MNFSQLKRFESSVDLSSETVLSAITHNPPQVKFVEFRRWQQDRVVKIHKHNDIFQLDYFPEGEGRYLIDGVNYSITPQKIFFVAPGHSHTIFTSKDHVLVNLSVKFTQTQIPGNFLPKTMELLSEELREIGSLLRSIVSEGVLEGEEQQIIASLRLAELLIRLRRIKRKHEKPEREHPLVGAARNYIRENLKEHINLDDIANAAGVAGAHLCRVFKKETGETIFDYLRRLRVERAKDMLSHPKAKIADIAVQTGFGSTREMNRAFQKFEGMNPRKFKQKFTKDMDKNRSLEHRIIVDDDF